MNSKSILLSWSGEQSKFVAQALKDWLPLVLGDDITFWFSETEIKAGSRALKELGDFLEGCNLGIICLNQDNQKSPWIMFESGALSKFLATSSLIPYLIGLESVDPDSPLKQFQAKKATKDGTFQVVSAIQKTLGISMGSTLLQNRFNVMWPQMDSLLRHAFTIPSDDSASDSWWIYSLVADTPEGWKDTLGYFHLQQRQGECVIEDGRAVWVFKEPFVTRGNWRSDTVWSSEDVLKFIYRMEAVRNIEGVPSDYEGYLVLRRFPHKPVIGQSCWKGHFNDLDDRATIKGPVYAEQLLPRTPHTFDDLKKRLIKHKNTLIRRVREFMPGERFE